MRRNILFLIALCLFLTTSHSFVYSIETVDGSALPGEQLIYDLTITNNNQELAEDEVNVAILLASKYDPLFSPSDTVRISPGENKTITLSIRIPTTDQASFSYYIPIELVFYSRRTQIRKEETVYGRVIPGSYLEGINLQTLSFPQLIDPRDSFGITAVFENSLVRDFNITINYVFYDSENQEILSNSTTKKLKANQMSSFMIPIDLYEKQEPGNYSLEAEAYIDFNLIGREEINFTVGSYTEVLSSTDYESGLFGSYKKKTFYNNGTGKASFEGELRINFIENFFVYEKTNNSTFRANSLFYIIELGPGESKTIYYKTTYLPLFLIPFVFIAGLYLYLVLSKKMIVRKYLLDYEMKGDSLVVNLEIIIKNLTRADLTSVEVIEKLPAFVSGVGGFSTMKPKISEKNRLVWKIDHLLPREERVITYKIKTKMGILGMIRLPPTVVNFKDVKNQKQTIESKFVSFETSFEEENKEKK
jgi:hypothetical protein